MKRTLPFLILACASPAWAQVSIAPGDDVQAILNGLEPGEEAVLADGTYELTTRFSLVNSGTAEAPIVIRAADGATPHFHRPNADENVMDVEGQHLIIRGLTFSGGSAGVRFQVASDITFEDCEIYETADVALRMNDGGETYARMQILRNHIHDTHGTGEGMYLGCNDDDCRVADSLIAGNHVHHTNAMDVGQGDGIELKDGSYGVTIRDNVIHDTKYPCILGYSAAGNGTPNLVEGNVMWGCGDNGIQWEADATLRNNIVLGAGGSAFASQVHQENGPANLIIVHNTFINTGDALAIRSPSGPVLVANNALYSMGRALFANGEDTSPITATGNAGVGSVQGIAGATLVPGDIGADFVGASFSGALPQNVYPTAGGALGGAGDAAHVTDLDFEGRDRMGVADIGAYALAGELGWPIGEGFKPGTPGGGTPGTDMGPSGGTDGGTGSTPDGGSTTGRDGGTSGGDDGAAADDDDGCGCRTAGAPRGSAAGALLLLALGGVLRRRRR